MPENEVSFDEELLDAELDTTENVGAEFQEELLPPVPATEAVKSESKQEKKEPEDFDEPEKYVLPIFGKDTEMEGDELIQLTEVGAYFMQNKGKIENALVFMDEVQNTPGLLQVIQDYVSGKQPAKKEAKPAETIFPEGSQEVQGLDHLIALLTPQLLKVVEEKYNPDVSKTMQEVQQLRLAQEFGRYHADPDYPDIVGAMQAMLVQEVRHNKMTMQEAAATEQKLRNDPVFFGQHFTLFKKFLAQAKNEGILDSPASPVSSATSDEKTPAKSKTPVRVVPRAPMLESGKAAAQDVDSMNHVWERALAGDANALSALYDMQI